MKYRLDLPIATRKIASIKLIRLLTGMGLKEAKDLVEGSKPIIVETDYRASSIYYEAKQRCNINEPINVEEVVEPVAPSNVPEAEKIESKGAQLFNVPNNEEGRKFLELCKRYINRHRFSGLRKKGRGKNRPKTMTGDLRIAESEWFACYPYETDKFRKAQYAKQRERWAAQDEHRKETEERLRQRIRQEIAMEQLQSGIILPEVVELVRRQVREEVLQEVGQKLRVRQVRLDLGDDIAIEVNPAT
jgi:hypothetical protein